MPRRSGGGRGLQIMDFIFRMAQRSADRETKRKRYEDKLALEKRKQLTSEYATLGAPVSEVEAGRKATFEPTGAAEGRAAPPTGPEELEQQAAFGPSLLQSPDVARLASAAAKKAYVPAGLALGAETPATRRQAAAWERVQGVPAEEGIPAGEGAPVARPKTPGERIAEVRRDRSQMEQDAITARAKLPKKAAAASSEYLKRMSQLPGQITKAWERGQPEERKRLEQQLVEVTNKWREANNMEPLAPTVIKTKSKEPGFVDWVKSFLRKKEPAGEEGALPGLW